MKPIAILASLLTLAAAQDVPTTPDEHGPTDSSAATDEVDPTELGDGPLAAILNDRAALYVDMAKTKHMPMRSRSRDPFRLPEARKVDAAPDAVTTEQARASAGIGGDSQEPSTEAQASASDPNAAVVERVQALEINAVLVANDGGSCLVRGDILRVGDTILGGSATLTRIARDGVSFRVGDRVVDVPLFDRGAKRSAGEPTPASSSASEDTNP